MPEGNLGELFGFWPVDDVAQGKHVWMAFNLEGGGDFYVAAVC